MTRLTPRGERVRDYGIVFLCGCLLAFPVGIWLYGLHV